MSGSHSQWSILSKAQIVLKIYLWEFHIFRILLKHCFCLYYGYDPNIKKNLLAAFLLFRVNHPSHTINNQLCAGCILESTYTVKATITIITTIVAINSVTSVGVIIIVRSICVMCTDNRVIKLLSKPLLKQIWPYWIWRRLMAFHWTPKKAN